MMRITYTKAMALFSSLRRAYCLTFKTPFGNEVLIDLAKFCRAGETCFDPDPRIHAALEGRREVWLRIQEHLHLTPEDLIRLRMGNNILKMEGQDDG